MIFLFRMYNMSKASHVHLNARLHTLNRVHLKFYVQKSFPKNLKKANSRPIEKMCI